MLKRHGVTQRSKTERRCGRRNPIVMVGVAALSAFLFFASSAFAGVYGYYHGWSLWEDYSSSYSTGWVLNSFRKDIAGFSTTVTWINNVNYGWSGTVTNSNVSTTTTRVDNSTPAEKGYCRANTSGFFGYCEVAG